MNSGAKNRSDSTKTSRRPKESRFLQQDLPACTPLWTPKWVVAIFMMVGIIFIPIGVLSLVASNNVVEIVHRYDDVCIPQNLTTTKEKVHFIQSVGDSNPCTAIIKIPKHMKQPIYVYYELDNYYQNHRRYVKSRSDTQLLKGDVATDTSNCKPYQNLLNNSSRPIIPCGLIAWSLFNDTYSFTSDSSSVTVNKTDISWKSDRTHRFGSKVYPKNFPNGVKESGVIIGGANLDPKKPLNEDEDLIVWMRTAALPNFRKLYGRIEQNIEANTTLKVTINNVYNTYSFGGKKKLVLSTTSWFGGKNNFLGVAYIVLGAFSIFVALTYFISQVLYPRELGDVNYLSWNKRD